MIPTRVTKTLAVATLLIGTALADSVTARSNETAAIESSKESCNKCDSPRDWSKITGVCFHDVGDRTNWFFRQPGGDFSYCGCCKVQSVPTPGSQGSWSRTQLNADTYCASQNGQHDIVAWYWNSPMHC